MPPFATALIAEDEPLLRQALIHELARAWPALQIVAAVGDGPTAVDKALIHQPQILFLDIRMPGLSGLDVAAELSDRWPADAPFPLLVFVTAHDEYAPQAFDAAALDYLLKPVQPQRLARTVARLQARLAETPAEHPHQATEALMAKLRQALQAPAGPMPPADPLKVIQASVGSALHLVPIEDVVVLEAADKYVRVITAEREYLIRTPLKELLPRLPADDFWQIHRGTVVRAQQIRQVSRDESGRLHVHLRQSAQAWPVSRLYAFRFKAM